MMPRPVPVPVGASSSHVTNHCQKEPQHSEMAKATSPELRTLLLDDEGSSLNPARVLRKYGFTVKSVATSEDALVQLRAVG
jgi:hypothetical protein